jgi:hypothetical protein
LRALQVGTTVVPWVVLLVPLGGAAWHGPDVSGVAWRWGAGGGGLGAGGLMTWENSNLGLPGGKNHAPC